LPEYNPTAMPLYKLPYSAEVDSRKIHLQQ
jgi:hypothetical protein